MNLLDGGKGGEGRMGERGWGGDGGRVGRGRGGEREGDTYLYNRTCMHNHNNGSANLLYVS